MDAVMSCQNRPCGRPTCKPSACFPACSRLRVAQQLVQIPAAALTQLQAVASTVQSACKGPMTKATLIAPHLACRLALASCHTPQAAVQHGADIRWRVLVAPPLTGTSMVAAGGLRPAAPQVALSGFHPWPLGSPGGGVVLLRPTSTRMLRLADGSLRTTP